MSQETERMKEFQNFIYAIQQLKMGIKPEPLQYTYLNTLVHAYDNGASERQCVISFTKWMHGFNVSDVSTDLEYLRGEVDEVAEAIENGDSYEVVKELADVAIYCYGMAQMLGMDLDSAIGSKMVYNLQRHYGGEKG